MPVEPNSNITAWLHLVAAQILVVEVLQPTAEFLLVFLVGNRGGQLGGFQHGVVDENRAVQAQGQRQGVARAGIHADEFAVPLQPDQGVEGFLFQLVDDHFANAGVESQQEAFDEVVSHGPRSGDFFDLQGYGVGLIDPHPDRKDRIAADSRLWVVAPLAAATVTFTRSLPESSATVRVMLAPSIRFNARRVPMAVPAFWTVNGRAPETMSVATWVWAGRSPETRVVPPVTRPLASTVTFGYVPATTPVAANEATPAATARPPTGSIWTIPLLVVVASG